MDNTLDRTFQALADPTRRAIVERLADGGRLAISEIAAPLPMSLPAVLKHVGVLTQAGLVAREKIGRTVYCRLEAHSLAEAARWLERYERFWSARLDKLAEVVEAEEETSCPPTKPRPATKPGPLRPTSRSGASSRRLPPASGGRGRSRKR